MSEFLRFLIFTAGGLRIIKKWTFNFLYEVAKQ
jgi:hypothetical protein